MPLGSDTISQNQSVIWHPSPNFGERRGCDAPSLIVLHYTAMDGAQAALDRLCDPEFEVSAHYLIARNGTVFQMVREADRAWHAGAGSWGACTDINSNSIGVELCNTGDVAFPDAQIAALITLLDGVRARWDIPAQNVIGHSDMAPDRKCDPGRLFPWAALAAAGQAMAIPQVCAPTQNFHENAVRFGYPKDASEDAILDAFRQRFRPNATGPVTHDDTTLMASLAATYPVDAFPVGD